MEKKILSPSEIVEVWVATGEKKANLTVGKMIILGIFAGMFIGFGAHADIVVIQTLGGKVDIGLAKLFGASVFPVGIMLVIMAGAELFTGNNLMTLSVLENRITFKQMFKNWIFVYIGNFIGSILLAVLLSSSGLYASQAMADKAIAIANAKINLTFAQALIRAFLCNILVVLACWMQAGSKDMIGKIFSLWFPIMLFVLAGFEHSIANMFFVPLGKFIGADISWGQIWLCNLIPVTLGNIVGGSLFVPFAYHYIYLQKKESLVV